MQQNPFPPHFLGHNTRVACPAHTLLFLTTCQLGVLLSLLCPSELAVGRHVYGQLCLIYILTEKLYSNRKVSSMFPSMIDKHKRKSNVHGPQ